MTRALRRSALAAVGLLAMSACSSVATGHGTSGATPPGATPPSTPAASTPATTPAPSPATHKPTRRPSPTPTPRRTTAPPRTGLPLAFTTGTATQVITVVAPYARSTTAILQAWAKTSRGWTRHGPSITAHVGREGLSTHKYEGYSATPIGSFTMTQAFGRDSNPGTSLPYTKTTPADWWVSQPSPLYNTRQRCAPKCSFAQGSPNEHLYYETPYYNYAVVIDYNTRNAPGGVRAGAGSAIFLHVTVGAATAGCVAIPQGDLTSIMRWLTPSAHPRMLIGVGS